VGEELEATRSELTRGVMELPEETRASAAAMRRVVAEQIEALAELNAIVRAQPATHDLNDRRAAPPPTPRREEPVARAAEPARAEPAAPQPAAPQPTARQPEARPAPQRPTSVASVAASLKPAAAPAAAPKPAAASGNGKATEEGRGWLRDVLRNASATASAEPAAQPQQGLTSLTEEIASSMDQGALAEAWRRYQSGEQGVFSRRIYTLSGQGTYDDVRKRIQRDPEFANTAHTYMGEFEQLLQQAAASPNPAQTALEYLLSERGRVYTMLAHASGRIQ